MSQKYGIYCRDLETGAIDCVRSGLSYKAAQSLLKAMSQTSSNNVYWVEGENLLR